MYIVSCEIDFARLPLAAANICKIVKMSRVTRSRIDASEIATPTRRKSVRLAPYSVPAQSSSTRTASSEAQLHRVGADLVCNELRYRILSPSLMSIEFYIDISDPTTENHPAPALNIDTSDSSGRSSKCKTYF